MNQSPINPHNKLDQDLMALRDDVLRLSSMVDRAMEHAMRALTHFDNALAQEVVHDDEAINSFRFKIEQECYKLLALQQPTARDMRSTITSIHIVVELERIGDYAAGIAKLVLKLESTSLIKPLLELPKMHQIAHEMLEGSMDAYVQWDSTLAKQVFRRDDEVDDMEKQVLAKLLAAMTKDPHTISDGTYLLWIGHNLERIADRITNICERVVFMVTGELMTEEDG